jgi:brefeldin A-resistance guanine nucleotide exchange factor 1
VLIQLREENQSAAMAERQGRNDTQGTGTTQYHPSMIYLLESAVILTHRDKETLGCLGESLLGSLQKYVRDAKNVHSATLSKVTTYLLKLLQLGYVAVSTYSRTS